MSFFAEILIINIEIISIDNLHRSFSIDLFNRHRCRNFGYADALSVSRATGAHRPRRESHRHAGSGTCQSSASRRRGGSRREGSAQRGFLRGQSGLSRIRQTRIGRSSNVPQRIRISRATCPVRSQRKIFIPFSQIQALDTMHIFKHTRK